MFIRKVNKKAIAVIVAVCMAMCYPVSYTHLDVYKRQKQCFGGSYTWEKRPVLIEIGSAKIAASLFGMPNGSGDITGCGMDGSLCLYFLNSKSDVLGGITDGEHAQIIQSAASTQ